MLGDVVLLLTAAVIALAIVRALRLPSLLAYILVGIAVGPAGLKWLPRAHETRALADFGVVFLMFSIGLEFSLPLLLSMRRFVFGFGAAQVTLTTLVTLTLSVASGMSWQYGLALGCALAMSSTAIVGRLLAERRELHSTPGQRTLAVLLFQDLAVIPFFILIPALGTAAPRLMPELVEAFIKTAAILAVVILLGHKLMQGWFDLIARRSSPELFMLNVVWLVAGLAFLTSWAGFSLALGAFVGGILISETLYRHQVAAAIRPFSDIVLGLFFITVGMQLDLGYVMAYLGWVAAVLALLVFGKGVIVLGLMLAFHNPLPSSLNTAVRLAQAGEFGLVLVAQAADAKVLDPATEQVALASMLLSMLLTPLLIEQGHRLMQRLSREHGAKTPREIRTRASHADGHVIICGYGRTGQSVARFLSREHVPFVALDTDPQRVREAAAGGETVVCGDADRREVLLAAGLLHAKAVVLAYADVASATRVLGVVRESCPDVPVIVRAADDSYLEALKNAGATEVVPEILEASLMLAMQTLSYLGIPTGRTTELAREIRGDRYALLRHFYRSEEDRLRDALVAHFEPRRSLQIPLSGYAMGKPYRGLDLVSMQVKLIGLVRGGIRTDEPSDSATVEPGDVVILAGAPDKLAAAERYLLSGSEVDEVAQ